MHLFGPYYAKYQFEMFLQNSILFLPKVLLSRGWHWALKIRDFYG